MGGFIAVYPFVPAADLAVGTGFDTVRVAAFASRWSLTPVTAEPGHFLTDTDIDEGALARISMSAHEFHIDKPLADEVDMAIDWVMTVGGTLTWDFSAFISCDQKWLDVPSHDLNVRNVFVVADAATARAALDGADLFPPGVWDVRAGLGDVPVIVRKPARDFPPEVRWNGWTVMAHPDRIEVQVVADHGFWGVQVRDVDARGTYLAGDWTIREVEGSLVLTRDGRTVIVDATADGPRIR